MAPSPGLKLLDVAGGTVMTCLAVPMYMIVHMYTIAGINPKMLKIGQLKLLHSYPMYGVAYDFP
ncbi:hypothetical protein HMI55_000671 [Coelomomyces lativittatus]|nr:hypothetical protein HMI55_000671 [Coelomomyces lativittatus]